MKVTTKEGKTFEFGPACFSWQVDVPEFDSHEAAVCFDCDGPLTGDSTDWGSSAGGRYVRYCDKCKIGTCYNLRAPVQVLAPEPTAVENGKKMCADCGLIALPPEKTYCSYCEAPEAPAPSAWDEIPRGLGYAIGAMMASGFMGGLLGYVWYSFTH